MAFWGGKQIGVQLVVHGLAAPDTGGEVLRQFTHFRTSFSSFGGGARPPPPSENVPPALLRWPGLTAPPEVSGSDVHWTNVHEGDEEWCHTSERGGQDPLSVHQAPRGSSPRGSSGNPNALVLPATYRGETGNPLAQVFLASYASAHITHMSGCGRSRNLTE